MKNNLTLPLILPKIEIHTACIKLHHYIESELTTLFLNEPQRYKVLREEKMIKLRLKEIIVAYWILLR